MGESCFCHFVTNETRCYTESRGRDALSPNFVELKLVMYVISRLFSNGTRMQKTLTIGTAARLDFNPLCDPRFL